MDAAIEVFADHGAKDASVRAIAAKAGVSPALITHHFGTKDALKAECDERVLAAYADLKMAGINDLPATMGLMAGDDPLTSRLTAYFLRAVLDGGPAARRFYAGLISRTRQVMDEAARRGQVRPECADPAHVEHLTAANLGAVLVAFLTDEDAAVPSVDPARRPDLLRAQLDVLTHGVFTDESVLSAFRSAFPADADAD